MTGQTRGTDAILKERLTTIQAIAAANMESLRLNQKASGIMVLDLMDERDGVSEHAHEEDRARNDAALAQIAADIERLEAALSQLDAELDAATKGEPE